MSTEQEPKAGQITYMVQVRRAVISRLLELDEPFTYGEIPDECITDFLAFRERNILLREPQESSSDDPKFTVSDRAKKVHDELGPYPSPGDLVTPCCAYSGFLNLSSEHDTCYECKFCGEGFDEFVPFEG